jgi:predicted HTH domain antitoxin
MTITVELPDDLETRPNPGREALEAFVIECYRTEKLFPRECRELLGMERIQFEGFLKQRGVMEGAYDIEQLQQDIETVDRLRSLGLLPIPAGLQTR